MSAEFDFQRLYDEHAQALFAFLLNFTRNEDDTRDLLQQIFVRLAREPDLLRGARQERAFLIRLAHNAAIDLLRRRGTRAKYYEQFGAELISTFAPAGDPDEQAFRQALSGMLTLVRQGRCGQPAEGSASRRGVRARGWVAR